MLAIIVLILILSFLVFIHEFGHFFVAKKSGVRVEEFGMGIPPKIWGKKVGETEYSLNLLPFGGFVKLTGEDAEGNISAALKDPENFLSKNAPTRAAIIVAGVVMNIIFAFAFYYMVFFINDFKSTLIPVYFDHKFRFGEERRLTTVVTGVEKDSPAFKAGINFAEAIIEVNDKPVYTAKEIREAISGKAGEDVRITLLDLRSQDKTRVLTVVPKLNSEGSSQLGVLLGSVSTIYYRTPMQRLLAGPMHAYNMTSYTFSVFGNLIGASVKTRSVEPVSSGVSGPIGMFSVIREMLKTPGRDTVVNILDFIALLSLSLGVMNLLPIPALDGGRLVFVVIEMVTRKRLHPSKEATIHKIGMLLLLTLIILVSIKDVRTFF